MGCDSCRDPEEKNILPEGKDYWEVIDRLITPYAEAFMYSADPELRAMGENGDRWYFRDPRGNILFDRGFDAAESFHHGVARVIEVGAGEYSYVDLGGKPIKQ